MSDARGPKVSTACELHLPAVDALTAHSIECDACRRLGTALAAVRGALGANEIQLDARRLSARALRAARPVLARRARWDLGRRVAAGVAGSLIPLPLVIAINGAFLFAWSRLLDLLLPAVVVEYFIFTWAGSLILLLALTYAAIPVVIARGILRPALVGGGGTP